MAEESAKEYTILGFLDNTSLSTTPKSPLVTSTTVKDLLKLKKDDSFLRKQDLSELLHSLFTTSQIESLPGVEREPVRFNNINTCDIHDSRDSKTKTKELASNDGSSSTLTPSDENSSLGILMLDGMSDFSESVTHLANDAELPSAEKCAEMDRSNANSKRTFSKSCMASSRISTQKKTNEKEEVNFKSNSDSNYYDLSKSSTENDPNLKDEMLAVFSELEDEYKKIQICDKKKGIDGRFFIPTNLVNDSKKQLSETNMETTNIELPSEDKTSSHEPSNVSTCDALLQEVEKCIESTGCNGGASVLINSERHENGSVRISSLQNDNQILAKKSAVSAVPNNFSSSNTFLNRLLQSNIPMNVTDCSTPSPSPLDASSFNVENLYSSSKLPISELKTTEKARKSTFSESEVDFQDDQISARSSSASSYGTSQNSSSSALSQQTVKEQSGTIPKNSRNSSLYASVENCPTTNLSDLKKQKDDSILPNIGIPIKEIFDNDYFQASSLGLFDERKECLTIKQNKSNCQESTNNKKCDDKPVVYAVPDGEYVTKLAFQTNLAEEGPPEFIVESCNRTSSMMKLTDFGFDMNEEFLNADDASKMLKDDEEKFEKDHLFELPANISSRTNSLSTSWEPPTSQNITRPSWWSDIAEDNGQSDHKISIGQFMRAKTEALGSLNGKDYKSRPHFGLELNTPRNSLEVNYPKANSQENCFPTKDSVAPRENDSITTNNKQKLFPIHTENVSLNSLISKECCSKTEFSRTSILSDSTESSNDSLISIGTLSRILSDTSSDEPQYLAKKFYHHIKERKYRNMKERKGKNHAVVKELATIKEISSPNVKSLSVKYDTSNRNKENIAVNSNPTTVNKNSWHNSKVSSATSRVSEKTSLNTKNNKLSLNTLTSRNSNAKTPLNTAKESSLKNSNEISCGACIQSVTQDSASKISEKRSAQEINTSYLSTQHTLKGKSFVDSEGHFNERVNAKSALSRSLSLNSLSAKTHQLLPDKNFPASLSSLQHNRHLSLETLTPSLEAEKQFRPLTVNVEDSNQRVNKNNEIQHNSSDTQQSMHCTSHIGNLRVCCSCPISCNTAVNCQHCYLSSLQIPSLYIQPHSCLNQCGNSLLSQSHGVSSCWPGHVADLQTKATVNLAATIPIYTGPPSLLATQPMLYSGTLIQCPSIQGPNELHHPEILCLGDSKNLVLPLHNPSSYNLEYNLQLLNVAVNECPLPLESSGFSFPSKVQAEGGLTKQVQIIFAAKQPGKVVAKFEVTAFLMNGEKVLSTSPSVIGLPLSVTIQLEVQSPQIAFMTEKAKNKLEFGDVPQNSTVTNSIVLINSSSVSVPVRLILSEEPDCQHTFSFDIQEMRKCDNIKETECHCLSPTMLLCKVRGQNDSNSQPSKFSIPLIFHAGKVSGNEGNEIDHVSSTVTAMLESSIITEALASAKLTATVGIIKLLIKDVTEEPLILKAKYGSKSNLQLTLLNGSCLTTKAELVVKGDCNYFIISPTYVELNSLQETELTVTFTPSQPQMYECTIEATVSHHNQSYKLAKFRGEGIIFAIPQDIPPKFNLRKRNKAVKNLQNKEAKPSVSHVESNRRFLAWGGLDIAQTKTKLVTFRNPSSVDAIDVFLMIKGDTPTFQLHSHLDDNQLLSMLSLTLQPNEDKDIKVAFTPQEPKSFLAYLYVKTENSCSKQSGNLLRSKIPLCGYGGVSKVQIPELPFDEKKYLLELNTEMEGDATFTHFTVYNSGVRPAFVKVLCFADENLKHPMPGSLITVQPSEFILMEKETKTLFVAYTASMPLSCIPISKNDLVGIMMIFYGDEILRQQLRFQIPKNSFIPLAPEDPLQGVNFDVTYPDEDKATNEPLHKESPKDAFLFYNSISRLYLHLIVPQNQYSFNRSDFTMLSLLQDSDLSSILNDTCSVSRHQAVSPPVKGTPAAKHSFRTDYSSSTLSTTYFSEDLSSTLIAIDNITASIFGDSYSENVFKIVPLDLALTSKKPNNELHITNLSDEDLQFTVTHLPNAVSVSPEHGTISPQNGAILHVNLITSKQNNASEETNCIKIVLGKSEKIIPVKIESDPTPISKNTTLQCSVYQDQLEISDLSTLYDSIVSYDIENEQKKYENLLNFPELLKLDSTKVGARSETTFQIFNPTSSRIRWTVIPNAPPFLQEKMCEYKKQVSATVISLTPGGGLINPKEHATITAHFGPKEAGNFTQLWEVCMGYENGMRHISKIHIEGSGDASSTLYSSDRVVLARHKNTSFSSDTIYLKSSESSTVSYSVPKELQSFKAKNPVYATLERLEFPPTECGKFTSLRIRLKNTTKDNHSLTVVPPPPPFKSKYSNINIKGKYYLNVPVNFCPVKSGSYEELVIIQTGLGYDIKIFLNATALPAS